MERRQLALQELPLRSCFVGAVEETRGQKTECLGKILRLLNSMLWAEIGRQERRDEAETADCPDCLHSVLSIAGTEWGVDQEDPVVVGRQSSVYGSSGIRLTGAMDFVLVT